jgi:hypothetical protein
MAGSLNMKQFLASVLAAIGIAPNVHAGDRDELRRLQAVAEETHQKLVSEGKAVAGQESTASWVAARERGYVNCLLTVLAEGTIDTVTVHKGEKLPDLKQLAALKPDLEAWASKLAFPYDQLSADTVLGILANSFELQNGQTGRLKTILVKNDGSPLAVIFYAERVTSGVKLSVLRP